MKQSLIILCLLLTLTGCQTNKSQSAADNLNNRITNANNNLKSCVDDAKRDLQVARFYDEIIYEKEDSSNKYKLVALQEKLNDEQVEVLKQAITILSKCRQQMLSDMQGTPYQQTFVKYYNTTEVSYIKLIKKEITIGEANEEKVKAIAQQRSDWTDVNNRLMAMQNADNESRRQAALMMFPYMMQQQQNQQLINQQQLQNINNNRQLLTNPITTNCLTNGNQTNCTSR